MARILIVEDEKNAREALGEVFTGPHEVRLAEDVAGALAVLEAEPMDLVLTDVVLPGAETGWTCSGTASASSPTSPVVVMTAYGSVEKAVRAMRDGAHDFLEKPLDLARLRSLVASALRARAEAPASAAYLADLSRAGVPPGFVGSAPAIREVFRTVRKAAPTNATVLILGDSGTGKELVARGHPRASPRARGPFVTVNCAALPEGLLESELFGHVRGPSPARRPTGPGTSRPPNRGRSSSTRWARSPPRPGQAPPRAPEAGDRAGRRQPRPDPVDVRVVAATNADLEARVQEGAFREDFYYRLKVVTDQAPRRSGSAGRTSRPLAEHFRRLAANRHGATGARSPPDARWTLLVGYDWPGNVRELENLVEAAVVLTEGETITMDALPVEVGGRQRVEDLPERDGGIRIPPGTSLPEAERRIILDTLQRTDGNKTAAARILGIGLRTLYRKLEQYEAGDGGTGEGPG